MTQPTSWHVSTESCHFKSGIFFRFRLARDLRRKFCKKTVFRNPSWAKHTHDEAARKRRKSHATKNTVFAVSCYTNFQFGRAPKLILPTFQTEKNKLCRPTISTYNLGRTKMEKQPRHPQNQEWNCWPTRASPPTPWFMWGLASLEQSSRNTLNVNKQFLSLWIRVLI